MQIRFRKNRRCNQEWTIQRYRQHWYTRHKTKTNKHKAETKSNAYTLCKIWYLYIYIEINLNTAVSHKLLTCQFYHYLFLIDHIINMAFAPI